MSELMTDHMAAFAQWQEYYNNRTDKARTKGAADGLSDTADTTDIQALRNAMRTAWFLAREARNKAPEIGNDEASFESYYWTAYGQAIYSKIYPEG